MKELGITWSPLFQTLFNDFLDPTLSCSILLLSFVILSVLYIQWFCRYGECDEEIKA